MSSWVTPDSASDGSDWDYVSYAIDDSEATCADWSFIYDIGDDYWCDFLVFGKSSGLLCDAVRAKVAYLEDAIGQIDYCDVDIYYSGSWHDLYLGDPGFGSAPFFYSFTISPNQTITQWRIRFHSHIQPVSTCHVKVYEVDFGQAISLPTVTTQAVDNIQTTQADANGTITDTGGENCDYRGFVWDTQSHSDPGNVAPASTAYDYYWTQSGSYGTGAFEHTLTSLLQGQTYYVRACAHNGAGWEYGSEVSFKTNKNATGSDSGSGTDIHKSNNPIAILPSKSDAGAGADIASHSAVFTAKDYGSHDQILEG